MRSRSSNERDWDSHSRARFGRALLLPKSCPSLCHRARVAVCGVFVCRRCVLRVSNGLPARSGATRSAYAAQNRARRFSTKQACRKLPRSVFRLRRASPPKLGHCPCGARRASPALVVLRGAAMPRLFDSACHDQIFIAASERQFCRGRASRRGTSCKLLRTTRLTAADFALRSIYFTGRGPRIAHRSRVA